MKKNHNSQSQQQMIVDDSPDANLACAKCGGQPDDILILTCDHNLCLLCAARNLQREHKRAQHSFQVYYILRICRLLSVRCVRLPQFLTQHQHLNFLACILKMNQMQDLTRKLLSLQCQLSRMDIKIQLPMSVVHNTTITSLPSLKSMSLSKFNRETSELRRSSAKIILKKKLTTSVSIAYVHPFVQNAQSMVLIKDIMLLQSEKPTLR